MNQYERERVLETELCKYQLMPFLRDKARKLPYPFTEELEKSIAVDIIAHMLFYKRTSPSVLIGLLHNRFHNAQKCLEVLNELIEQDYLDYSANDQIITKLCLSTEDSEKLAKMMYPQPMVVPPSKLKRNSDTGYWYMPKGCIVLRSRFQDMDVNLDHLNRVNSIKLKINKEVLHNRENKPKKELPTIQARANWNKFVRQQREIAESYEDTEFYLTHKYDKRGRIYCQGYHISYQSNDFTNALVEFANGEKCI